MHDRIDWRRGWPALMFAGFLAGFGALIPSLPVISLCMIAAGGLAITFYKRRLPTVHIRPALGFRIGAVAGLFGFMANALLSGLGMLSSQNRSVLRAAMNERIQDALNTNPDASAQEMLRRMSETIATPSGFATIFIVALMIFGLLFIMFSGLGGAIGATLFGRSNPHE